MLKDDFAVKKAVAVITDSAVEESKAKAAKKDDTAKDAK